MKQITRRLAVVCTCAFATAGFTGVALAGNEGAGKAAAAGQQKKAEAAQVQTDAQVSSSVSAGRPDAARAAVPGQAKQHAQEQSAAAPGADAEAGVKPSSTTTAVKWTHCVTGGTAAATTCTAVAPTPNVEPDVSKQYGNGTTAAQIAVGRGGNGVTLTGPGNSQPHKVSACGKPSNPSGGVDVHAVKSYDSAACQATVAPPVVQVTSVCGSTTTVTTSSQVVGVLHGRSEHLMTNPKSAHFTKHGDTKVSATVTDTKVVPTGESCGSVVTTPPPVTQQPVTQQTGAPATAAVVQGAAVTQASPATQPTASASTAPTQGNGGVLAAHTSTAKPKAKPAGGVLGEVTNVSGSTLPFTGFPVWAALLAALALVGGGLVLRRAATTSRA
jgi:hypothetical protein